MRCEPQDYVLIDVEGSRALARVEKVKSSSITVTLNGKHLADKNEAKGSTVKVSPSSVLINFDKTVPEGKTVLGFRLEPWYGVHHLKRWGRMHFRRFMDTGEKQKIIDAFDRVGRALRKMGLDYKMPIEIEVLPPRGGKMAGRYINDPKSELDTMQLFMKELVALDYVIWHETGHHIWIHFFTDTERKVWIDTFHGSVQVEEIDAGKLRRMRKDLVDNGNIREFRKGLEDSEKIILKEIFRHIKTVHHLKEEHLQILLNEKDDLKSVWPKNSLEVSDVSLFVSDYARTAPDEMFCESLAFYKSEMEMHPTIKKLIKRTMMALEAQHVVKDRKAA